MDSIKDIISRVVEKMARQEAVMPRGQEQLWRDILKKNGLKNVKLIGPNAGKMLMVVDSPARLYHARTRKDVILKQIRKHSPEIQDITIRVGNAL